MSSHNRSQFFNRVYGHLSAAQQQQLENDEVASLLHLASGLTNPVSCKWEEKIVEHIKTVFICSLKNKLVVILADGPRLILQYRNLSRTVRSGLPWSDILYWCESPTGGRSEALNITTASRQSNFYSAPVHLFYCYKVEESSLYLTLAVFPRQLILMKTRGRVTSSQHRVPFVTVDLHEAVEGWGGALITNLCTITQSECFPLKSFI